MSNWTSNFANIPYNFAPIDESITIDSLFQKKESEKEDINIEKMIELKDEILSIIHDKEIIDLDEDVEEEEEKEKEKESNKKEKCFEYSLLQNTSYF